MQQEEKYNVASVKPTCANHRAISDHLVFLLSGGTFLRTLNRRQFHLCLFQPCTVTKQKKRCQIPILKCILVVKRTFKKFGNTCIIIWPGGGGGGKEGSLKLFPNGKNRRLQIMHIKISFF